MTDYLTFTSTSQAKELSQFLKQKADIIVNMELELNEIYNSLVSNWEGDGADFHSVFDLNSGLSNVLGNDLADVLSYLSYGIEAFAEQVEAIGSQSIKVNGVQNNQYGSLQVTTTIEKQTLSDFWDYSQCSDGWDYVTTTFNGVVATANATTDFVLNGINDIFEWIF